MTQPKVFITGASGFLGSKILEHFNEKEIAILSRKDVKFPNGAAVYNFNLNDLTDYIDALRDIEVIIHCAALAHVVDTASELQSYRQINTEGTLDLARQAAKFGVKRFVFISSIGVNGGSNLKPFKESDAPEPQSYYAQSKLEAEQGLWQIQQATGMEIIIIRPPLVYGPSPPGNFSSLIKAIKRGYPLPLGSAKANRRSLIALDNLVDFILLCTDYEKSPLAANQTFLISDGDDISTVELLRRVSKAFGKKSRLFPFPLSLLRLGAKLLGKQDMADSLLGSLQIDSSKARELLGWKPVITMDKQLKKMAEDDGFCQ